MRTSRLRSSEDSPRFPLQHYAAALGVVILATLIGLVLHTWLDPDNIAFIYLAAVVISATTWGLGPSIFTSLLSVFLLDDLFIPPFGLLSFGDGQDLLTLAVYLLVAVVISQLGSRVRTEIRASRRREQEISALYTLSRETAFVPDASKILDVALEQISKVFGGEAVAFVRDAKGILQLHRPVSLSPAEWQAARWAYEHRQATGRGAPVMPEVPFSFLPLQTAQGVLGVVGISSNDKTMLTPERRRLLEAIAGQVAVALEHAELSARADEARLLAESDRFRNALLSSISHDLRTPLASITGSVTSLLDPGADLSPEGRNDLLLTIKEEAARLNRLVANLLNMTRLESGGLRPQCEWYSMEEVIGAALDYANLYEREVRLDIVPGLNASIDFVLIQQVLLNLLDNAIKFSPPGSLLEITAMQQDGRVWVSVADRGTGIPEEDLTRVFDKFYRCPSTSSMPGTGLGLSICKGIVEAHGGSIRAERREGGGTCVIFTLPLEKMEN